MKGDFPSTDAQNFLKNNKKRIVGDDYVWTYSFNETIFQYMLKKTSIQGLFCHLLEYFLS